MKSVGSHGSSSLLFMVKGMVWHFVSDSHKVMTAVIVMLPSGCCEDFCTISWIQWLLDILLVEGFWVMDYVWHPVFVLGDDSFQIMSGFMLEFDITQGYLCCRKYFKNRSKHRSTFGSFVPLKRQGSIGRRNLAIFKTKVFSKLYFFLLSHTFESLSEHSKCSIDSHWSSKVLGSLKEVHRFFWLDMQVLIWSFLITWTIPKTQFGIGARHALVLVPLELDVVSSS